MSTGDSRRSAPKKSTTPAAAGDTDAETTEGPVGGVLPVKKTARAAGANGSAARRTDSGSTSANGARPAKAASKAAGSTGGRSTSTDTIESTSVFARKSTTKAATKAAPAKAAGGRGPSRPGKGGRAVTPVKVAERRNWGPIFLYSATGLVALLIIGFGAWPIIQKSLEAPWQEQAAGISGIVNYLDPASPTYNQASTLANHQPGDLNYEVTPPVGGNHNSYWQQCMGNVYTSQIADEHAVHSLEHGAVWVTYSPDLPQDQIDRLAERVRDREYLLMSPHPGLDSPISLQAWGYQLKVDDANDGRIDDFINALRINATQEPDATCSGGITDASPTPINLGGGM